MNTRKGFTLMETLFAMVIIGIAVLALAGTMPLAARARKKADYSSKAISLAQKEIENMRYIGYKNLTDAQLKALGYVDTSSPGNGSYTFTNVDVGAGDSPAKVLPSGTGSLTVSDAGTDLRQVTVRVDWTEKLGGRQLSYTTSTIIGNL